VSLLRPFARETLEVACDVDIAQTPESFHAHAVPDGVDIRPGDVVMVHGVPAGVGFGEHLVCRTSATIRRAGLLERGWTQFTGLFEITGLYEVGFEPKETP
jgi:hypothetical protein